MTGLFSQRPGLIRLAVGVISVISIASLGWFFGFRQPPVKNEGVIPPANLISAPSITPTPSLTPVPSLTTTAVVKPTTTKSPSKSPSKTVTAQPKPQPALELDTSITPRSLNISGVNIKAPIVPEFVTGVTLDLPADPNVVGWWANGAAPGSPVGTVLLAAHIDSKEYGKGVMVSLKNTAIGSTVTITGDAGQKPAVYKVQARRSYSKSSLPFNELFAQGDNHRLVIVTCGGTYNKDAGGYSDNVVVVATPIQR